MDHKIARPTPPVTSLSATGLNLKCVRLDVSDFESKISISADFRKVSPLIFKRPDAPLTLGQNIYQPNSQTASFSAYLGRFHCQQKHFLVFANRVVPIKFGHFEVYKVTQVVVYLLHSVLPDILLSQTFTEMLGDRLLFSYFLDLTQNVSEAYNTPGLSANPFFASLANLFLTDYLQAEFNWFLPVVVGAIATVKFGELDLFLLYKESCFDVNPECRGDLGLLIDFYAPTTLNCTQFLILQGEKIRTALSLSVSGFPGIVSFVNDDKEKLEGSNFNPQRVYRFIQFFNEFHRCDHFIFQDSAKARTIFRKLSKFVRSAGIKGPGVCAAEKFVGVPADSHWEGVATNAELFVQKLAKDFEGSIDFNLVFIAENRPSESDVIFRVFLRGLFANKDFQKLLGPYQVESFLKSAAGGDFLAQFALCCRTVGSSLHKGRSQSLRKHLHLMEYNTFNDIYSRVFGGKHE